MMKPRVFVHDIGLIDYQEGWDYQEKLFKQSIDHKIAVRKGESSGPTTNHLLFCEHPHVYTLGKSGKNILKNVSTKWKFDLEEMKSLTSDESSVVKISNLKKNYE